VPYTLVVFHAHPDDEALLTAGTMARASSEGHRVVLVVATAGGVGLVSTDFLADGESLADRRTAELRRSATALGCARTVVLGYADSGLAGDSPDEPGPGTFAGTDVEVAARRLADLLVEEQADALIHYDPAGGYGHPDHVQVHQVGRRAAELAGTPLVLQATVDRDLLTKALRLVQKVYRFPPEFDPTVFDTAYTPAALITHRVDVRRYALRKRMSMAAHASQATADGADRTLAAFLRIPVPLFRRVFGREWYVEQGRVPGPPLDDLFATLGTSGGTGGGAR
jgi:LmbE family N-acetylglucosaminyl deacetylase